MLNIYVRKIKESGGTDIQLRGRLRFAQQKNDFSAH